MMNNFVDRKNNTKDNNVVIYRLNYERNIYIDLLIAKIRRQDTQQLQFRQLITILMLMPNFCVAASHHIKKKWKCNPQIITPRSINKLDSFLVRRLGSWWWNSLTHSGNLRKATTLTPTHGTSNSRVAHVGSRPFVVVLVGPLAKWLLGYPSTCPVESLEFNVSPAKTDFLICQRRWNCQKTWVNVVSRCEFMYTHGKVPAITIENEAIHTIASCALWISLVSYKTIRWSASEKLSKLYHKSKLDQSV